MNDGRFFLRLYPRTWRDRYEEEFLAVLAHRPLSVPDAIGMIAAALDAHLHPQYSTTGMPPSERRRYLHTLLRRSLLATFCAYSGFIIPGLAFQKLTEDAAFIAAAHAHATVGIPFALVLVGSLLALLAICIGGLPIAAAVCTYALAKKRRGILLLLVTPVLAFVILCGASVLWHPLHIGGIRFAIHLSEQATRILFSALLLAAATISTAAVCRAVARSPLPGGLLHFALLPATVATVAMALMLVGTIFWGLDMQRAVPHVFAGNQGIWGSSTAGTWLAIIAGMASATGVATLSLAQGITIRSALRATRTNTL